MFWKIVAVVIIFGAFVDVINGVPTSVKDKPFIIGGVTAPEAYAPHMAALVFDRITKDIICGGSIISRRLVLTAAHCIEPMIEDNKLIPSFRVIVGTNNWNSGGTVAKVKDYVMHPKWDSKNIKNDIGVVILKRKLKLNDRVAVIPLDFGVVGGCNKAFVTGWGATGPTEVDNVVNLAPIPYELQLLYLHTLSHRHCEKQMTSVAGEVALPIERDIEICTFHSYNHGTCKGDSGSALVKASTGKQIGIVSWGFNCASGAPDVYVRISGFKPFLLPIMRKYGK
ncbi:unnamed protein product [Chrysodeixis includens]|uniref:Peptidase S1 domain-containing protein n=1 Tax=Chrysodeixis includens TaxID=689277 RepID=A0A9N8PXY4_CHRIL|nr:unnamed protein product [Chrysodeixis includens]